MVRPACTDRRAVRAAVSALILGLCTAACAADKPPGPPQGPPEVVGIPSVIDADTLEIGGRRVRLEGIDAPESAQLCERDGVAWRCGQQAALALDDFIARRTVSCWRSGTDRYQRLLARCYLGEQDLQDWLVRNGWALAYVRYSKDYVGAERAAQGRLAGVWGSRFVEPWEWRAGKR